MRHRLETTSLPSSHGYSEPENKTPIACEHCINPLVSVKTISYAKRERDVMEARLDFYLSQACWFCSNQFSAAMPTTKRLCHALPVPRARSVARKQGISRLMWSRACTRDPMRAQRPRAGGAKACVR